MVRAIKDTEITYSGDLDAEEILSYSQPDRARRQEKGLPQLTPTSADLSEAKGTGPDPDPVPGMIAYWSFVRLLPFLVALAVLRLLVPMLRAADRGDPFTEPVARRMQVIGGLLFWWIPLIAVLRWTVNSAAGSGMAPQPTAELTISVAHFLPGALVLALGLIFAKGVELRDLERHTV